MKNIFLTIMLAVFTMAANAQTTVDKITTSYIGVKDALVASNSTLAKSRSKELLTALAAQPAKGLSAAQVKVLEKLKYDSRHISETTLIDHQREHFESLSKNMFTLLSAAKQNTATVYQQYCPMKKAYWLSDSEEIRNPYYGDDMLECGKVTATIKGK